MTRGECIKNERENVRHAAYYAASNGRLRKDIAQTAIDSAVMLCGKQLRGPSGESHPDYDELFVVWVPRGTVPGRWHRAIDFKGREGSVIVWGEPDEWEFAGKLYIGRKAENGPFPFEISKVSAEMSTFDAPPNVVRARMAEREALKRASHCPHNYGTYHDYGM